MKLLSVEVLAIPDIKIITYQHFCDPRGYFTEHFRKSQFAELEFMQGFEVKQCNESSSTKGVIRGLHFQCNPYMGKLVRTVRGNMVDIALDIRKNSPTFGKAVAYQLEASTDSKINQWIWLPPGFAHGNVYLEDTHIEYFCTGEYSPKCEAGISPQANIDWSLCDQRVYQLIKPYLDNPLLMSPKDLNGYQLDDWIASDLSNEFIMYDKPKVLVTGGSGVLGTQLKSQRGDYLYPMSSEFNVSDYSQMYQFIQGKNIKTILHCAAFTDTVGCTKEDNYNSVIDVNIIGTSLLVKLCNECNIRLIYISTDYVFEGTVGNYKEVSSLNPVAEYGWSKLGGECSMKLCKKGVIIRLSFGGMKFEHPKAFVDQYTSRESVDKISEKIIRIVESIFTGVIHIGSERRSIYQYAKQLSDVGKISINDVNFDLPKDTSLDVTKFNKLFNSPFNTVN